MLSQRALKTMLLMRNRAGTLFSNLPRDVVYYIADINARATFFDHVANGRPDEARAMLIETPRLIFFRGRFETPSGLVVENLTAFEFALADGDPEMAEMIGGFYNQYPKGPEIREQEYAKYKPHIDAMLARFDDAPEVMKSPSQDPMDTTPDIDEVGSYDFQMLIDVLKKASDDDVTAALKKNFEHKSELNDALKAFREYVTLKSSRGVMHFDYQELFAAFEIYEREFDALPTGWDENNKRDLFWRQVIGFIQRLLPAVDRMAFAQGICYLTQDKNPEKLNRSLSFMSNGISVFPDSRGDDTSKLRLGYDYAWRALGRCGVCRGGPRVGRRAFENYLKQKQQSYQNLEISLIHNPCPTATRKLGV